VELRPAATPDGVELKPTAEEDAVRAAAQHMILGGEERRQQLPAARRRRRACSYTGLGPGQGRIFDGLNKVLLAVARWLDSR
jgi:hypothetical protein